jgi:hypothetical protein
MFIQEAKSDGQDKLSVILEKITKELKNNTLVVEYSPLTTPQTASTSANHSQTATVYHQSCT